MQNRFEYNETMCLKQMAKGNERAFEQLYFHNRDKVFYCALRIAGSHTVAEDLVQEVFMKLWENRMRIIAISNYFVPYLLVLTKNHCFNYIHKRKKELSYKNIYAQTLTEAIFDVEEALHAKELYKVWQVAIHQLPGRQQQTYLYMSNGYDRKSVAVKMAVSEHTVKEQMNRAKKSVRMYVRDQLSLDFGWKQDAA